jgi:SAM-dependent methyltransferase
MSDDIEALLAEQIDYYRARASEYDAGAVDLPGGDELAEAVHRFRPRGDVLELACGPGTWTPTLLRTAGSLTAIDSSPEMLAIAAERVGRSDRVRFVQDDLFGWRPDRRYDAIFFGFWISHVPEERFAEFWSMVADALAPGGRVMFVDDAYRTPDELVEGPGSSRIRRRLEDGTSFHAVKVPHTASALQARLDDLGWEIAVHATAGPFYWGVGGRPT